MPGVFKRSASFRERLRRTQIFVFTRQKQAANMLISLDKTDYVRYGISESKLRHNSGLFHSRGSAKGRCRTNKDNQIPPKVRRGWVASTFTPVARSLRTESNGATVSVGGTVRSPGVLGRSVPPFEF